VLGICHGGQRFLEVAPSEFKYLLLSKFSGETVHGENIIEEKKTKKSLEDALKV